MQLCLINNDFKYELEKLIRIFLPFEKIEFLNDRVEGDAVAIAELSDNAAAELFFGGKRFTCCREIEAVNGDFTKDSELFLALALFECLKECFDYSPQWGILTGVRPAKLFSRIAKLNGAEYAENYFKNYLMVSDKKIALCKETAFQI